MEQKRLIEEAEKYLMNTYRRYPVVLRKGSGVKVYGIDGKEYLDFVGGIAVNILGHCPRKVVIAVQKQVQRLIHVSNLYHIEPQIKLAKLLVENSFADRVFFCNSGAEANEGAIKLARKFAKEFLSPDRYEIITCHGSFHGRTYGALTATAQEKFHNGFGPLLPGFKYVPFNDIEGLRKAIDKNTCAVMIEPVQGEGGVKIPDEGYLKAVRSLCDDNGILLILDEVQTGMGRTGRLFCYEHYGIRPDIMTLAKGLGAGIPIGAILATEDVSRAFTPGTHASTFGGNPVACAAAIATIETLLEDDFILDNVRRMGSYFLERLHSLKKDFPDIILSVRGMGLLTGMELLKDCTDIVQECLKRGLLINCTAGNVLRFTPPLTVEKKHIDVCIDILEEVFSELK
ncbi:MAG: acetylornithine transaminase [Thermodesulfovibrionales bacterium]